MSVTRVPDELRRYFERTHTIPAEWAAKGCHWCHDWDSMLVCPGDPEMDSCCCRPRPEASH